MTNLVSIDSEALAAVTGGQAQQAPQTDDMGAMPPRTWGQMATEYGAACAQGAASSLIYGGRPQSVRQGAGNAAIGCALGVGMKAVDDLTMPR